MARAAGFTLLELVVVLSILGLVTALVGPPILRGIESWQRRADVDAMLEQVRALPGLARAAGQSIRVDDEALASSEPPLQAPPGWALRTEAAWSVRQNGACEAGQLVLARPGRALRIEVAAPFCEPTVAQE